MTDNELAAVHEAARRAGLSSARIELIRRGSHAIYRLSNGVVGRLGSLDSVGDVTREITVAHWLHRHGIDCVQPIADCPQPTIIEGSVITWWWDVGPHQAASPAELGRVLRAMHQLPQPTGLLTDIDPLEHRQKRLPLMPWLDDADQEWLVDHMNYLSRQWAKQVGSQINGDERVVVHGDAWQGNLGALSGGRLVLFDLDHVAIGPPAWDLAPIAVDHTDFNRIDETTYRTFVDAYGGYDVTTSPTFRIHADLHEFRWLYFALQQAADDPSAIKEATHRLRCLQGEHQRPWTWTAL